MTAGRRHTGPVTKAKRKPGPQCAVCQHPERVVIDERLIAGASYASISREFAGISEDAAWRHWRNHVAAETRQDWARVEAVNALAHHLEGHARRMLAAAEAKGDIRAWSTAFEAVARLHERQIRLSGLRFDQQHRVEVVTDGAALDRMAETLAAALEPWPGAANAVAAALVDDGLWEVVE